MTAIGSDGMRPTAHQRVAAVEHRDAAMVSLVDDERAEPWNDGD